MYQDEERDLTARLSRLEAGYRLICTELTALGIISVSLAIAIIYLLLCR